MATKTSILIFYLRMSRNTQKVLRIASYVTLGIVNIAGVVLTFLNAFQCNPVYAAYETESNGKCISIVTLYLCSAPVNIITDLAILVLPIPVLTGMRLPQRQKTVLVFTFALGVFVTIVDVVRIYYLQQAVNDQVVTHQRLGTGIDFSYSASTALMWSAVEVNVGIICACIPTLKPLIKRILPAMITDRSRTESATEKDVSIWSQIAPDIINGPHHRLSSLGPTSHPESHPPAHRLDSIADPTPGLDAPPPAQVTGPEAEMGMMDFLTTPEMEPGINRTTTAHNVATENTVYFGFVNMKRPKSMLKTRGMESFKYCTMVTMLFFLWGFSYGLLNTLNNEISKIAGQSTAQTLGLTTSYFGAYFFGAMTVGQWVLRNWGFKATFISGLCIYGTGTLMFWPSAVLTSFPGFIISNFVVGFGLSVLETAANPFLALCGPSQYAEYRLLLAQGVQGIGSILSQLLAQRVLFSSIVSNPNLIDVQWTYLAIALFDVILALFFYYMPLPEATDTDLQNQSEQQGIYRSQTVLSPKLPLIYVTLGLALFAQFCYVGAQESTSVWIRGLLIELSPPARLTLTPDNYILVGHTTFAIGRFIFAALCLVVSPRILLFVAILGCLVFSILTMSLKLDGNGIAGPLLVFYFFEGPVWPIIFATGLRGLGKKTKQGAACLTASACGGGIFPFIMWAVQRMDDKTVQYSYCVNVAVFAFGILFPLYLNLVPKARKQVDPMGNALGLPRDEIRGGYDDRPDTPIRRLSRRFSVIFSKIGGGGKQSSESQELPVVEHRERVSRDGIVTASTGMGRDGERE